MMTKLFVLRVPLLLIGAHAAFFNSFSRRVPFIKTDTKFNVANKSPVDWMPEIDSSVREPITTWVVPSSMHQAIECAEGSSCDMNELTYHLSSLMQLDDECLFEQAFESIPTIECSNTRDRHLIQRILQIKHELHSLQQELKNSTFAKSIKQEHEDALQNNWYTDYLEFYHM